MPQAILLIMATTICGFKVSCSQNTTPFLRRDLNPRHPNHSTTTLHSVPQCEDAREGARWCSDRVSASYPEVVG
jgi:hypothetical protein